MPKALGSQSIAELEGEWPAPQPGASRTAVACYEIRKKPLSSLSVGELRMLIGQDIGLPFLVPLALSILEKDPLVEADHYRGDLLTAMLRASPRFLQTTPEARARIEKILESMAAALDALDHVDFDTSSEALEEAIARYRGSFR